MPIPYRPAVTSSRRHAALLGVVMAVAAVLPAVAVERLTLSVERIDTRIDSRIGKERRRVPIQLSEARLEIELGSGGQSTRGRLQIGASPLGQLDLPLRLTPRGNGQQLALGPLQLRSASILDVGRQFFELPADLAVQGSVSVSAELANVGGSGLPAAAVVRLAGADLGFSNGSGTYAAEDISFDADLTLQAGGDAPGSDLAFAAHLDSARGEMLLGSAYLKLGTHPSRLELLGKISGEDLELTSLAIEQRGLLQASGSARLRLGAAAEPRDWLQSASLELQDLQVPAAYATYLQTALAGTALDTLESAGSLSGRLEMRAGEPWSAALTLQDISLRDARGIFYIHGLRGQVNWTAADAELAAEPSLVAWDAGGTYDIGGGAASMQLRLRGRSLTLLEPARLPVFDGAVNVQQLGIRDLGLPSVQFDFAGGIEPISLGEISKAFGWPAFGGVLRGRIPAVGYHDGVLRFDGDLEAEIFDGRIRGSNIRLAEPFGRWPRLTADVTLENLDLETMTSAFEFGRITGRLEGRIDRLELFDWKPVSFDAWLRTPPDDRSRKHISVDAINSIANVGGTAGSGVSTALRSGALRLFSRYHYRQLAVRCILEDDVCRLSGAPLAGDRYYLLQGAGIPRVNIIGYSGRVQWSQLIDQISWQIMTGGTFRIE